MVYPQNIFFAGFAPQRKSGIYVVFPHGREIMPYSVFRRIALPCQFIEQEESYLFTAKGDTDTKTRHTAGNTPGDYLRINSSAQLKLSEMILLTKVNAVAIVQFTVSVNKRVKWRAIATSKRFQQLPTSVSESGPHGRLCLL